MRRLLLASFLIACARAPIQPQSPDLRSGTASADGKPLVAVELGNVGQRAIPLRLLAPLGQEDQARIVGQSVPRLVELLEDYLGQPYPYPNLEIVSVPPGEVLADSAGRLAVSQGVLLSAPSAETSAFRQTALRTVTRQLARQWLGDVPSRSSSDLHWQGDAFAIWLGDRVMEHFAPDSGVAEERVQRRNEAMAADSVLSAIAVRQPIAPSRGSPSASESEPGAKGAALLTMFEQYLGPRVFQAGVRRHLAGLSRSPAEPTGLFDALSASAGGDLRGAVSSFTEQPGVPLVDFNLECTPGASALLLAQQRFLPTSVDVTSKIDAQRWEIPVCVRWSARGVEGTQCHLLTQSHERLPLTAPSCPDWVVPNAGSFGYYRSHLTDDLLKRVLTPGAPLTASERLGLVGDVEAQVLAGQMPMDLFLSQVRRLATDSSRSLNEEAIDWAGLLRREELGPLALKDRSVAFVTESLGARLKALGWRFRAGEPAEDTVARARLLSLLGESADDAEAVGEARALADNWLAHPDSVDPDVAMVALEIAASHGDRGLFDRWHQAARIAQDPRVRRHLLKALASFRDPEIVQAALALVLSGEFAPRESMLLIWGATDEPANREAAWAFVRDHVDALATGLPPDELAALPWVAAALCDDRRRPEVEALLRARSRGDPGAARQLDQALESLHQCSVFRQAQAPRAAGTLGQ